MIWLLVATILGSATLASLYEWVAVRTKWFPAITTEVRQGERNYRPLWFAIYFAIGIIAGHFWQ